MYTCVQNRNTNEKSPGLALHLLSETPDLQAHARLLKGKATNNTVNDFKFWFLLFGHLAKILQRNIQSHKSLRVTNKCKTKE